MVIAKAENYNNQNKVTEPKTLYFASHFHKGSFPELWKN